MSLLKSSFGFPNSNSRELTGAALFARFELLSEREATIFAQLFDAHRVRRGLPSLPLLVWQRVISHHVSWRDALTLRCCSRRLRDAVPVRIRAVAQPSDSLFERAWRGGARRLERLPARCSGIALPIDSLGALGTATLPVVQHVRLVEAKSAVQPVTQPALGGRALAPLAALAGSVVSVDLHRTSSLGDDALATLCDTLPRLTRLHASTLWRLTPPSLDHLRRLTRLRALTLEFCLSGTPAVVSRLADGDECLPRLAQLTGLQELFVSGMQLPVGALGHLSSLHSLERLLLRDVAIHEPSAFSQLTNLPLRRLVLMFGSTGFNFTNIEGLTRLDELALIGDFGMEHLERLSRDRMLRGLALKRLGGRKDVEHLSQALRNWSNVRSRAPASGSGGSSSSSSSSSRAAAYTLGMTGHKELESFSLWASDLVDAEELAFVDELPLSLRRLSLTLLDQSAHLDSLLGLRRLENLRTLCLDECRLSSEALTTLFSSGIAGRALAHLSLFGVENVSQEVLESIAQSLGRLRTLIFSRVLRGKPSVISSLKPLRSLSLLSHLSVHADKYIDNDVLATLVDVPQLWSLDVSRCPRVDIESLRKVLPKSAVQRVLATEFESDWQRAPFAQFFDRVPLADA